MGAKSKLLVKKFENLSLKAKFVIILIGLTLPSSLFLFVFAGYISNQYNLLLFQNTSQILHMSITNIENDLRQIEKMSDQIIADSAIQKSMLVLQSRSLNLAYLEAVENLERILSTHYNNNEIVMSITLYTREKLINVGWETMDELPIPENILERLDKGNGRLLWYGNDADNPALFCMREVMQMEYPERDGTGFLLIKVDLNKIVTKNLSYGRNISFVPILAMYQEERLLYNSGQKVIQEVPPISNRPYAILSTQGQQFFQIRADTDKYQWHYIMSLPFDAVIGSMNIMKNAMLITLVALIAASVILGIWLVSFITVHFDYLLVKMRQFQAGDYHIVSPYDYSTRGDELGTIHRNFDQMVVATGKLVQDNYIKQLLIRDANIKALQQQINPHFLFNILQTINWMAKAGRMEEVSQIVESLGRLLRYTLSQNSEVVTIEEEMSIARDYVAMQRYRYCERLEVSFDIQPSLYRQKTPKLAIQAIIENAINHGLEKMLQPCVITVCSSVEGSRFLLTIEDNGPGIEENILELLESEQVKPSGLGIGLRNIHQRIQLIFSVDFGLRIFNTGHGTKVIIELPKGDINV